MPRSINWTQTDIPFNSLVFRWHSGPGLRPHAFAPPNGWEGCGTKLPACSACRGCGSISSFESTGSAGDADRWGFLFNSYFFLIYPDCWGDYRSDRWSMMWTFVFFFLSVQKLNSPLSGMWSWMRRSRCSPQRSSSPRPVRKVRKLFLTLITADGSWLLL